MNIKITYNWLREYLETNATPFEIQKYLSLCGPSVESIEKVGSDFVFDIEVTSNRVDMASVVGIAQEACAILPQFGKKAKLKENPLEKYRFSKIPVGNRHACSLHVKITKPGLCSRFTAVVLSDVKVSPSPEFIQERLTACGIKSINNVIDISNYLMIALGQPTHVFDYDRIAKQTMIMRDSIKGERLTTLDGKSILLPGGDIVIEDGTGRLIDLCGIMGGLNSAVTAQTKNVVLFVQTYNKQKIRKTSMTTGQRTVAATYFEKGLDEERVGATLVYGIELLKKHADAKVASELYDIYPKKYKEKTLDLQYSDLEKIIGVNIEKSKINKILQSLGFKLYNSYNDRGKSCKVGVPSYRQNDINIPEDLVEEVARVYGYHNLPNNIQPPAFTRQPQEVEKLFLMQQKVKYFLKHLGLHEVMNYSMISKEMIEKMGFKVSDHAKIKNSISKDLEYLRRYITPSLLKNIKENEGKCEVLRFFEIAKGYVMQDKNLPQEYYDFSIVTNTNYSDLKGIIDALFEEFHIQDFEIEKKDHDIYGMFNSKALGEISIDGELLGRFGTLDQRLKLNFGIKSDVYIAYFNFKDFIRNVKTITAYKSINPFATVKLDLTVKIGQKMTFYIIKEKSFKTSKLLRKLEVIDRFKDNITLRFYFASNERNITEEEAKAELEKIKKEISSYGTI